MRYSEDEKLELVALILDVPVLHWYTWEAKKKPFTDWRLFKRRMLERFLKSLDEEPWNRLCALKQTGSVRAYVSEFEVLIMQVEALTEANKVNKLYI